MKKALIILSELILGILEIFIVYQLSYFGFDIGILAIITVGIILFDLLLWFLRKRKGLLIGFTWFLIIVMLIANIPLVQTNKAFDKINKKYSYNSYSVVVLKDSEFKRLADLKNRELAVSKTNDSKWQKEALDKVKSNVDKITILEDTNNENLVNQLFDKKVSAILINEATRSNLNEINSEFNAKTKVLKNYRFKFNKQITTKRLNTNKTFNIFISGIDTYGALSNVSRSDVNLLASVNPKTKTVILIGMPRDLYVSQPCQNNQKDKLTHAGIYGVKASIDTISQLFHTKIDYYARVNFSSVVKLVDSLGGIEINSDTSFTTKKGGYLIKEGMNNLNGNQTLGFVRERYALEHGDNDRNLNQMKVVNALIKKLSDPSTLTQYASVLDVLSEMVDTNLTQKSLTNLIELQLKSNNSWKVINYQITGTPATLYSPANGFNSYMLVPNQSSINEATQLLNDNQ